LNNALAVIFQAKGESYDAMQAAQIMRAQHWCNDGHCIDTDGITMKNLIANVNDSIDDGMVLPMKDGREVTFQLDSEVRPELNGVQDGDIILCTDHSSGAKGNHFLQVDHRDPNEDRVLCRNSWLNDELITVPDDPGFGTVICNYSIYVSDIRFGDDDDETNDDDYDDDS